jgi:hypothetical protein
MAKHRGSHEIFNRRARSRSNPRNRRPVTPDCGHYPTAPQGNSRRGAARRPEAESRLSKFAFEWITCEAALAGLLVDRARIDEVMGRTGTKYAKADPDAKMHESLTFWWRLVEIVPKKHWNCQKHCEERRMNLAHRRTIPPILSCTRSLLLEGATTYHPVRSE